jgi:LuxR family maltose regulon positive regulatory protein
MTAQSPRATSLKPRLSHPTKRTPKQRRVAGPFFELDQSKFRAPDLRSGMVHRDRVVHRLRASRGHRVVSITAPPGYGKTTVLAQWARRDRRAFAWVSLDERDNDPSVLLTYVAAAVHRTEAIDPGVFDALASPGLAAAITAVSRLGGSLQARSAPVVLVLDDLHLVSRRDCVDAVLRLAEHLPEGSQMALVSRGEKPLPLGRLRAQGKVMELGASDLAMDPQEATALLKGAGVDLPPEEVGELHRQTEGWPVALYLAALARKSGSPRAEAPSLGRERFVVDYLHTELLDRLPPARVAFLTRTSVLDRMTGPLCDAVLDRTGSAYVLDTLERSNRLVIPLDRERRWYRYHHLFRDLLQAELERRSPGLAQDLASRAARWCEDNGLAEAAISYAMRAGDADRVARLLVALVVPLYYTGRIGTIRPWLAWFDHQGLLEAHPEVALVGALLHAVEGHAAAAERWADVAERGAFEGTLPDGTTSWEGWIAYLRSALCRNGVEQMRADGDVASENMAPGTVWLASAITLLAMSHLLSGNVDGADELLERAIDVGEEGGATGTVELAERALIAIERGQWDRAGVFADSARANMREAKMEGYLTSILVYAAAARVAIHRGEVAQARKELASAQRVRPMVTHAMPFWAVQARLELARAHLALSDPGGARTLLREADGIVRRRPGLGILPAQVREVGRQIDAMRYDVLGASTLTTAELRILPLLATHLSFREIGEQLYVSSHTVKSQAISIYRKLGVTSRSDAIRSAATLGLLEK